MPGNTFGQLFRLTTFGESHGPGIGGIIDGVPAGMIINEELIRHDLSRRRPGQSAVTTDRDEKEDYEILSGVYEGKTLGSPIAFVIRNKDQRSSDYENLKDSFRPSHADFTYATKYGHRDHRGGGRSSARETAARVFAGSIAKTLLEKTGLRIFAYVSQVGKIVLEKKYHELDFSKIETNAVRCPDEYTAKSMITLLEILKKEGDTTGGVITCVVQQMIAGLGEPVFDKLQADLSKACLSINAAHGFEYGSGFAGAAMLGSEHNDPFAKSDSGKIVTQTNNSGGVQGGISNGMDIYFRVAFKPISTIQKKQTGVSSQGEETNIEIKGRHDPCVVPRAVPIVEAMTAITLADHMLRNETMKMFSGT